MEKFVSSDEPRGGGDPHLDSVHPPSSHQEEPPDLSRLRAFFKRLVLAPVYWLAPVAVWTVVVGVSLMTNLDETERHAMELATARGRFIFQMLESIRLWNARHGGVYVPVTAETVPNPYLKVRNRDIPGPDGITLTKVNPAYMTRQLTDILRENNGVVAHITSLKPLNPGNAADPWEIAALQSFESGAEERTVFRNGDVPVFRYMAPLVTQNACLECHRKQGYKVGDIRGGISVSFAPNAILAAASDQHQAQYFIHGAVWLLLSGISVGMLAGIRRQMVSLQHAKNEQDYLVERRTAQLNDQVHERHRAERELRMLIDSSGDGILRLDINGNCTLINPVALELLGYETPDELIGKNVRDSIYHSMHDGTPRATKDCRFSATFRDGVSVHELDTVFWRKDGSAMPVEYRAYPIVDDGTVLGAVVTFVDITIRKKQEAELRKLSSAVAQSPSSVVITNADKNIEYVNKKFTETTGFTAEEVIGENPRILKSGHTPQETYESMHATLQQGKDWQGEFYNRKKDGTLFWEDVRISPVTDERGTITHFVAVKADITERKRTAEEIWRQANYDVLTGLPNRSLFRDRLAQALAQGLRSDFTVALLYLDLDGFKKVNDTLGHDAGDQILKESANRMSAYLRSSDTVARLGGDEFAVILPMSPKREEIEYVAERIVEALRTPFGVKGQEVHIGTSIGIAIYPGDAQTIETLVECADASMYRAKQSGGASYHFHSTAQRTDSVGEDAGSKES